MLDAAIAKVLEPKLKPWPNHTNRISGIDDPCTRRLFYSRTAWDKAKPRDLRFAGILESGNKLEPVIRRIVSEIGEAADVPFRIVGQDITVTDKLFKRYNITGHIDGILQFYIDDKWVTQGVIDIKTSTPAVYRGLHTYEDLGKYSWTRKYRGQLMLYALGLNLSKCFILFVNKGNLYDMRPIEFKLDYEYAEKLLQKAEDVNLAIECEEPPEKLNDPDVCPDCDYCHICKPEYSTGGNLQISDNSELQAVLDELHGLDETKTHIAGLEKSRDHMLVKGQDLVCGGCMVLWKEITSNRKATEATTTISWRKKIVWSE